MIHVTAETSDDAETTNNYIEHGPHVAAETSRRIACDSSVSILRQNQDGQPINIGRKSRSIPPAMRRALRARDEGCRFPGCTHKYFIDGHHIEHWADGGETSLENLVQLCRHHHRLVHEGGFICERHDDGQVLFRDQVGRVIDTNGYVPPSDYTLAEYMRQRMEDIYIDSETCVTKWYAGEYMDYDLAVGSMFQCAAHTAENAKNKQMLI